MKSKKKTAARPPAKGGKGQSGLNEDLVRNLAHDLKSPLSVILADIMLMRQTYPSILPPSRNTSTFVNLIDSMERSAIRMRSTIENVLEADLLDAREMRKERVDISELASRMVSTYGPIAEPKGLALESHVDPSLFVSGDPGMLLYVMTVLMSNAVKFTVKGKVAIAAEGRGSQVEISVSDTGFGISKDDQKHVFEKHFKADPSAPGTGQGLYIARQIVEAHGGKLRFESAPSKGSTFIVSLPKNKS